MASTVPSVDPSSQITPQSHTAWNRITSRQRFGANASLQIELNDALRLTAWFGANNQRSRKPGVPGEAIMDYGAIDLKKGGSAIPYHEEDPYLRAEFSQTLAKEGAKSRMEDFLYTGPVEEGAGMGDAF